MTIQNEKNKILIVEDNFYNLKLLGTILRKLDYSISVATDGHEALKILENIEPSLILLDLYMPEFNGFETCKRIKANPKTKDIPIIILTASGDSEDKIKGFKAGAVDYITKPFDEHELNARITTHINLRNANVELKQKNLILEMANEKIKEKNEQLKNAMKKLDFLAKTDPLTNTFNRRYMYEKLKAQKELFSENKNPFSIIIADIDFFKDFNDVYGHLCGDVILQDLTSYIQSIIADKGYLSRWGGEEFLILLPQTDCVNSYKIAENIRKQIRNKPFEYRDNKLKLTLTFGVTTFEEGMTLDEFIKLADEAMYEGKRKGRNCVVVK